MSEKGNADRSSEQSSEQCSEDSRVKSPEDQSETVPYTREQWESLPTDPDPEINLGYDYMDWEEFETKDGSGQIMFLPSDEDAIRDDAYVVADQETVLNLGQKY